MVNLVAGGNMLDRESIKQLISNLQVRDYVIGFTVFVYIIGFLITNTYLGGLGVFSFDLVRAKYISAGIVFIILFAGPIYYFRIVLTRTLHGTENKDFKTLLIVCIKVSLWAVFTFFFLFIIMEQSFTFEKLPVGIPFLTPPKSLESLLTDLRPTILSIIVALFGLVLIEYAGRFIAYLREFRSFAKDKNISFKKYRITNKFSVDFPYHIVNDLSPLIYLLGILLIGFLVKSQFDLKFTPFQWGRYLYFAIAFYLWFALQIFLPFFARKQKQGSTQKTPSFISWYFLRGIYEFFLLTLMLITYSFGVYPFIPQQLGGGKPVEVNLKTENPMLFGVERKEFLLDRSSNGVLVLSVNPVTREFNIIEVPNLYILSIEFLR